MDIIEKIRFMKPTDGEVIVLYFDKNTTDFPTLQQTHQSLVAFFPNNKVIALEKNLEITTTQKDSLIQYLQS